MIDTLYVTDLDGTLLNSWKRIPADSVGILNRLIADGAAITVASARAVAGVHMVKLEDVDWKLPLVLMNGAVLYDFTEKRIVERVDWHPETVRRVVEICERAGKKPFMYYVKDGNLTIEHGELTTGPEKRFRQEREDLFPGLYKPVEAYSVENAVYLSVQDREPLIRRIAAELEQLPDIALTVYPDNYNFRNFFLEAYGENAGKGNGVRRLRRMFDARRVVVFGDNYNDLPLFEASDLSCAVAGAPEEVRAAADVVIGASDEGGVAKFILEDFQKRNR